MNDIPPPSANDQRLDLGVCYGYYGQFGTLDVEATAQKIVANLIRRCHAVETQFAVANARIAELEADNERMILMGGEVNDKLVAYRNRIAELESEAKEMEDDFAERKAVWKQSEATIAELREALRPFAWRHGSEAQRHAAAILAKTTPAVAP